MDKRKTTKTGPSGVSSPKAKPSARKLAREQIVPEMDRYLRRLGVTGLVDDGAPK
jgi:hypothetical protein